MLLAPEGSDSLFASGRVLRQDRGARRTGQPHGGETPPARINANLTWHGQFRSRRRLALEPAARQLVSL